ncbi:MAG: NAD(+) diphosphatase [Thermomonas sp.]
MPFAFLDADLDRADDLRGDAEALARLWSNATLIAVDAEGRALAAGDDGPRLLPAGDVENGFEHALLLGVRGHEAWFAIDAERIAGAGEARTDLRQAAAAWPAFDASLFAQARAMRHWRERHRYCSVCGGENAFVRAGWLGRCTRCGAEHYPRTDPAVIVAITDRDGERLLLGRQASWPEHRYSTLAGFVEPGESLEQTIVREVREESGVRVLRSRYLASQPWPFPGSLMLGFVAEAEPDAPVAGDELEDARWFTREEVGAALRGESPPGGLRLSPSISISRWLVERWFAGERVDVGGAR